MGLTCLKRGLAFLVRHGIAPGDQRRELEDEQRFPHTRITVEHAESAKGNVGMPEPHDLFGRNISNPVRSSRRAFIAIAVLASAVAACAISGIVRGLASPVRAWVGASRALWP